MDDEPVDTGLAGLSVTATVTDDDPQLPAVIVPAAPMPEGWTIHKVAALVRELAMNMYDVPVVLKKHGLSEAQYDTIKDNEFFKRTLEAETIEWNRPQSTTRRLAIEAAIALEDALPAVAARLSKANEPLPGVVELAKLFAKMAGVGENANAPAQSEKFKITINLGADVAQFDKQRGMLTIESQSVQQKPEGEGAQPALQYLPPAS